MNKEELKKIIVSQSKIFDIEYVKREKDKELELAKKTKFITIITGIRRCGKSTIMNHLRLNSKEKNYFLNFDDNRLSNFNVEDFEILYESFLELYGEENTFYFDEIQNIKGWEKFVRRLHNENCKVYITGSNASMLSKELGTHLTGRNIQITLFPFSFKEFLSFKNFEIQKNTLYDIKSTTKIKKLFEEYIRYGSIPEFLESRNENYLKSLYENILYRDVMIRYNLSNEKTLKDLIHFLISNIGTRVSFNSIKNILSIANSTTIKEYISYFKNSYLLFQINKYDYSLKKQLVNPKKIYVVDTAIADLISFKFSENLGRILENIVFLKLKRDDLEIYYHYDKYECDFLTVEKGKVTKAIQVTLNLNDEKTKEREISGLLDAMNTYNLKKGLILTNDEEREEIIENKKIIIKPIWKWLLDEI